MQNLLILKFKHSLNKVEHVNVKETCLFCKNKIFVSNILFCTKGYRDYNTRIPYRCLFSYKKDFAI